MINEKQFISNYNSFWDSVAPLQTIFQRKVRLDVQKTGEKPIRSTISGRRRSYISFVAQSLFMYAIKHDIELSISNRLSIDIESDIEKKSFLQFKYYSIEIPDLRSFLTNSEWIEIYNIAIRTLNFFKSRMNDTPIEFNPHFRGCGFVDTCYGDVYLDNCLYEIKMVDRNFRNIDFRQILTYCCLNKLSKRYVIERVNLYNPVHGVYFETNLNEFCYMISGKNENELLEEICSFMSGGSISK